jgi:L-fuculose-phosphate aldolase
MSHGSLRQALHQVSNDLVTFGFNKGSAGNCSVRLPDSFLITPSAIPPALMKASDMVELNWAGQIVSGKKPSSEWRFHKDIYLARPDVNAIIHTHSMFSTTLACMHQEIPAFHYMIAMAGADSIRCAPYALFGTQALSDDAVAALSERKACLLANHGLIVVGKNLIEAYSLLVEVENLAEQYWRILQVQKPNILSQKQMQDVLEKFKQYKSYELEN